MPASPIKEVDALNDFKLTLDHWYHIVKEQVGDLKAPKYLQLEVTAVWPAPGSEDTELGVLMEPEVGHGEAEVYTRVQA